MLITSDVCIGEAAKQLGVAICSVRRWEAEGRLPFGVRRSIVGRRLYAPDEIEQLREFVARRHPVGNAT